MKPVSFSAGAFSNLIIASQYSHFSSPKARLCFKAGNFSGEVMKQWFHKDENKKKAVRVSYRLGGHQRETSSLLRSLYLEASFER
jgi:hypothetical protein